MIFPFWDIFISSNQRAFYMFDGMIIDEPTTRLTQTRAPYSVRVFVNAIYENRLFS